MLILGLDARLNLEPDVDDTDGHAVAGSTFIADLY
jgi:hypothetical protein